MVSIKKYDPLWVEKVKLIVKKTEKKKDADGNDTTVDISSIGKLIEERKPIADEVAKLEKYISDNTTSDDQATDVYSARQIMKRQKTEWENHLAGDASTNIAGKGYDYLNLSNDFRNTGQYAWNDLINAQYTKPITTGTLEYTNNLYELDLPNHTTNKEIVEEEVINVLGRVFEGLGKIDAGKFKAKFATFDNVNAATINTWIDNIQHEAKLLTKSKDGTIYDFGYTFRKHHKTDIAVIGHLKNDGTYNARPVRTVINEFLTGLKLVNKEDFLKTLTDDISHSENVSIKLKGEPYTPEKLEEYGINVAATQTIYKQGTTSENYLVQGGVKGWIGLAGTVGSDGNKVKLSEAFNNSPNHDLFDSMGTSLHNATPANRWNEKEKSWHDGTRFVGLDAMPKSIDEAEKIIDSLKIKSTKAVHKTLLKEEKVDEKRAELSTKKIDLTAKETEIQALITEELKNIRAELKKVGIESGKTFAIDFPDGGTDNRKSITDLITIKDQLENVRFLENNDIAINSSVSEENTAYTLIDTLWNDYAKSKVSVWSGLEGATNADKCKKIKSNEIEVLRDLQPWLTDFEKWEKLIKFDDNQKNVINDIKIAMGKQEDPTDTLKIYQDKLKAVDALLDDTVITQAVIDDWQTQNNFKTSATVETEIKKVIKDGKLNEDFKKVMIKEDADITDLANLFKKKKAKDIITMIRKWEYDKDKESIANVKNIKIIKMCLDKKKDDTLTEEEITEGLYKVAVSEYSKTDSEIQAWEKVENQDDDSNKKTETSIGQHLKDNWYWYLGGTVVILVATWVVFGAAIKKLWNPEEPNKGDEIEDEEEKNN